jgi:tubulin polyglutamylase TTLL4
MEEIESLFSAVPLPYSYLDIPDLSSADAPRTQSLFFYVNRVITDLSKRAFRHGGISQSPSLSKWNFSWGRQFEADIYSKCKSWQKINHFAGAYLMGRKDGLHERMTELRSRLGHPVPFYPESYLIPSEYERFGLAFPNHPMWIVKPAAAARGNGIKLIAGSADLPCARGIYQVYISRPLLITGRKFDLRLYVLVTSIAPLRIYMHHNGMARFAVHQYSEDVSVSDLKANLTNFSLNHEDDGFVRCSKSGPEKVANSKWSLEFFMEYLRAHGVDTAALLAKLESVTLSTVIAGVCAIRKHHRQYINHRHTSYELYGIDILLDENFNPYVMEINISPGMDGSDSALDKRLKEPLMNDTLRMARFVKCDCKQPDPCPGIDVVDRMWRTSANTARQIQVFENNEDPWAKPVFSDFVDVRDFMEERCIQTGFRRVYPKRKTMRQYDRHFDLIEYRDFVFQQWIAKPAGERLRVIRDSFSRYESQMLVIYEFLERLAPQSQNPAPGSMPTSCIKSKE